MPVDIEHTRKYSVCRDYAATATCRRPTCRFNHGLIETTRIFSLVGDTSQLTIPPSSSTSNAGASLSEKTLFLMEYTKYSAQSDVGDAGAMNWRMRLLVGGRATLSAGVESVSVQPMYPLKGQGLDAGVALNALEDKVFGRSPIPNMALTHSSICKAFAQDACPRRDGPCRFSHTLFDTKRIERLLEEAVSERGYRDYKPLLEVEYVARQEAAGCPTLFWRITLRAVLAYHQKSAPQPVVITSADLNMAMRLLERQFAGGSQSGSTPRAQARPPQSQTNTSTTNQFDGTHRRTQSATVPPSTPKSRTRTRRRGSNAQRPSTSQPPSSSSPRPQSPPANTAGRAATAGAPCNTPITPHPNFREPPPSYHDTVRGNTIPNNPSASHDAKRRL